MSRHRRKKRKSLPDSFFQGLARRIDSLTVQWRMKWPHGVDPEESLKKELQPLVRRYLSGERTPELLQEMEAMEARLTIPGLCEVSDD